MSVDILLGRLQGDNRGYINSGKRVKCLIVFASRTL
jgi:hypothetical protein